MQKVDSRFNREGNLEDEITCSVRHVRVRISCAKLFDVESIISWEGEGEFNIKFSLG